MGENYLRGVLPQPKNGTLWKIFSVSDNYLNGIFPTFIGNLRNLGEFQIQVTVILIYEINHLILVCFAAIFFAEYLHLDENGFSGLIPDNIVDLDKLIEFTASANALRGSAIFPGGSSLRKSLNFFQFFASAKHTLTFCY